VAPFIPTSTEVGFPRLGSELNLRLLTFLSRMNHHVDCLALLLCIQLILGSSLSLNNIVHPSALPVFGLNIDSVLFAETSHFSLHHQMKSKNV
jgi:hypothetical protein